MATTPDSPAAAPAPPAGRLDYAPPPRRRRWRRWVAAGVLCALAAAAGLAGRRWWPAWKQKRADMALDRACLDYAAPADLIVFSNDPADAANLMAANRGYQSLNKEWFFGPVVHVWYTPAEWMGHPLNRRPPGPAFLHRRTGDACNERLVAVLLSPTGSKCTMHPLVCVPTTFRQNRGEVWVRHPQRSLEIALDKGDRLRVYAGQPDPADPSRFTIGIRLNDGPGVIDGRLLGDDAATLVPRGGVSLPDSYGIMVWRPDGSPATRPAHRGRWLPPAG